ncbi:MAG: helix-turn-helix domain-containing protein [Acidimicrobiia bacterium]|nr:helix-turn-helix domain-containing protein [Acidimicrobiia bacterium]
MTTLLTTRDVQALIKVDKSTIYRMAEAGRIPAIKVGRQWRFPEAQLMAWLGERSDLVTSGGDAAGTGSGLGGLLPPKTIQALADLLGDVLGAMVVITDMEGKLLTEVANPCGLFAAIQGVPGTLDKCIEGWREFGVDIDFTPRFIPSHIGFLCSRGFVRVGSELKGMVIVGGIAPAQWPPEPDVIAGVADELGMPVADIEAHIDEVYHLDEAHMNWIASLLPGVGTLISHLASERGHLVTKLEAIASLAGPATTRSES